MKNLRRIQLLTVAIALSSLSKRLPSAYAQSLNVNAPARAAVVYSNGALQQGWSSWSWGLAYKNQADTTNAAAGSTASMCVGVQQFGALSLRSARPFAAPPAALLGFYLRGGGDAKTLGDLEVQVESNDIRFGYSISNSLSLREILKLQEKEDGTAPGTLLAAAAAGRWVPVRLRLGALASVPAMIDRITLGSCLQAMEPCDTPADDVRLCLDHVIVAG